MSQSRESNMSERPASHHQDTTIKHKQQRQDSPGASDRDDSEKISCAEATRANDEQAKACQPSESLPGPLSRSSSSASSSSSSTISMICALESSRETTPSPSLVMSAPASELPPAAATDDKLQREQEPKQQQHTCRLVRSPMASASLKIGGSRASATSTTERAKQQTLSERAMSMQHENQYQLYNQAHSFQSPHLFNRRFSQRMQQQQQVDRGKRQSMAVVAAANARQHRRASRSSSSSLVSGSVETATCQSPQAPQSAQQLQARPPVATNKPPTQQQQQHHQQSISARRLASAHSLRLQLVATSWLASIPRPLQPFSL